jgi:hypothetical protein
VPARSKVTLGRLTSAMIDALAAGLSMNLSNLASVDPRGISATMRPPFFRCLPPW